jgi:hypothetical protein
MVRSPILTAFGWALLAAPCVAQDRPDFSGSWMLKEALALPDSVLESDSAPPIPSDLQPVLRRRGNPEDQQELGRLVAMAHPVAGFQIEQTDTAVTFENHDGFTYTLRPGAGPDSVLVGEEWIWMRARWRDRALEVEVRPPGDGRIIETYHMADSEIFLRLEVVVEHDILAQRLWRSRMYRLQDPD